MKTCPRCGEDKENDQYYEYGEKLFAYCKVCARAKYKVDDTDRRRHNPRGMWLKRYQTMTDRVTTGGWGPYKSNAKGKELLSQKEFLEWCQRPEILKRWKRLHRNYIKSDYDFEKIVTVDRIDSDGGYSIDNIQWLPMKANQKKG